MVQPRVAILALGAATRARNEVYRSQIALWRDTVAKRPDNPRAHHNLGMALAQAGVSRREICVWILHPGGRDVLEALRLEFGLDRADLRWSAEILREYGNLSSASLYFILRRALSNGAPPGWWWLCSFGAGFSCHGALLHVT